MDMSDRARAPPPGLAQNVFRPLDGLARSHSLVCCSFISGRVNLRGRQGRSAPLETWIFNAHDRARCWKADIEHGQPAMVRAKGLA